VLTAGERAKLIEQYADGPRRLRAAFEAVPPAARQWRPAPGEWSAHEVVVHCADSETQSASRIHVLVADKEPVIQGYDEAVWARDFNYHAHPLDIAFDTVAAVRGNTTALLRRFPSRRGRRSAATPTPAATVRKTGSGSTPSTSTFTPARSKPTWPPGAPASPNCSKVTS
jgi:hypothetical protein